MLCSYKIKFNFVTDSKILNYLNEKAFMLDNYEKCYIICTKLKNLYYGGIIMIDIKFLRENPEIVKENIKKKFQDEKLPLVDEVIELDVKIEKQN